MYDWIFEVCPPTFPQPPTMKESLLFEIGYNMVRREKPKYLYGLVARSLCRKNTCGYFWVAFSRGSCVIVSGRTGGQKNPITGHCQRERGGG